MGLGGVEGPPKKKLKQAQLNFCVSAEKTSNKRKLTDSPDGLAPKLFRTDSATPKTPVTPKTQVFNKENVIVNGIGKTKDDIPKETPGEAFEDDRSECRGKVEEVPADEQVFQVEDDHESQGPKNNDFGQKSETGTQNSETETTQTMLVEGRTEAPSPTTDEGKSLKLNLPEAKGDTCKKDETESTDSMPRKDQVTVPEVSNDSGKPIESGNNHADPKLDNSADSEQAVNTSIVLSSEDEQVTSPKVQSTPTRKVAVTPKSSTKKAERERLREEKLRLKKEKEEQKRKEREEKEKKKQEDLKLKEEEKKRKEEERKRKEEDKKRKEEERKKKEDDRRKKEEEKKKKEEMKEEDRRKKEEVRLAEERKENLAKAAFTKFFITEKSKPSLPKKEEFEALTEGAERPKFMPFPVKSDMRLAVQVRHTLTEKEKNTLSEILLASNQPVEDTYLKELKSGRKPKTGAATWPLSDEQHDVIIVESVDDDKAEMALEENSKAKSKGLKAKLLQFHENRRPPYWGTWQKPSKAVGPRRPFGQDKILDYEVDSDSEWEDEEEGEDIEKEDGDSEKEEADDENVGENGYVLDNTFVPHGYLSDEEADEAEDDDSVENQKLKLTVLKQEFDQELKSKTQRLQPRLLGCVRIANTTLEASKSIYELLMKLRCKWGSEEPIDVTSPVVVECSPSPSVSNTKFPSSMVEQLAKLIHGNRSSMKALISEFINSCDKDTQLSAVSKRAVFLKVKEIAAKTYSSGSGRLVWAVNPDLCAEFGLEPILDPPKTVPIVSPVVEPPKPKGSPLASFLKKTSTPQGSKKRIATTLIPRDGPSGTPCRGHEAVHIDTPRPKFTPQGSIVGSQTNKPIRRVSTTLLSSVAGPVKSKTFNVSEINKPGQVSISSQFSTAGPVSATVDLTESNDGITPLSHTADQPLPPILAACDLTKSPDRSTAVPLPANSNLPAQPMVSSDTGKPSEAPVKDGITVVAEPVVTTAGVMGKMCETTPMDTDTPTATSDAALPASTARLDGTPGPPNTDLNNETSSGTKPPSPMETDDLPELQVNVKPITVSSDNNPLIISSDPKPLPVSSGAKSPVPSDSKPPTVTVAKPQAIFNDAKPPTPTDAQPETVSNDAKSPVSSDAKTPEAPKSVPRTSTPVRKRVPLITLSKCVSKTKTAKTPGQNQSIAEMFCRKPAKNDTASEPVNHEASAVVDLCTDSN